MQRILEAFLNTVESTDVFSTLFVEDYTYFEMIESLCSGDITIPRDGIAIVSEDGVYAIVFPYRVGPYKGCGYVYDETCGKCYATNVGTKICVAAMEALRILDSVIPVTCTANVNKKMLMRRKVELDWVSFFWKNKRPCCSIKVDSSQSAPSFCVDAANRLLAAWMAEGCHTIKCEVLFKRLRETVLSYYTLVTQYPGIGVLRTYYNPATDIHVLYCELDGENIIVTKRYEGIAVLSRFGDDYSYVAAEAISLDRVEQLVYTESPVMDNIYDIRDVLGVDNETAVKIYRALPEKSRKDFLSNLKHSFERGL